MVQPLALIHDACAHTTTFTYGVREASCHIQHTPPSPPSLTHRDVICDSEEEADGGLGGESDAQVLGMRDRGARLDEGAPLAWQCHWVTLLFPADRLDCLPFETRRLAFPDGRPTTRALLSAVRDFYAEQLSLDDLRHLLLACLGTGAGTEELLRCAFLAGQNLARADLLGPRLSFEGLHRSVRGVHASVYEVCLGC